MDWKRLSPWNWLKKEDEGPSVSVSRPSSPTSAMPQGNSLLQLHQQLDSLFNETTKRLGFPSLFNDNFWGGRESMVDFFKPSLDIKESEQGYTIEIDMPGLDKKDVHIELDARTLTISGEKLRQSQRDDSHYHRTERCYGRFQRVLSLPSNADTETLKANFASGVLTLTIDKAANDLPRSKRIEIQ